MKRTSQTLSSKLQAKQAEIERLQQELELAKRRERELMNSVTTIGELYRYIGFRLRELREAAGMTQVELSDKVTLTRTSLVNIENGSQRTPVHMLWMLCKHLKVQWTAILPEIKNTD